MPVLVFLHEGLGSVALWKNFPELVAEATGCSALVYSRYGYGKSDRLTEPRRRHHRRRNVARAARCAFHSRPDPDQPATARHLTSSRCGRRQVRGLVLMAPHVFVEDITVAAIAQAKTAFETSDLAAKLGRYQEDAVGAFRGWNDIWLHPDFLAWNIESCLPGITTPALLIHGEDDQYGTMAQIEALERQLGGAVETVVLARCAHSPHVDQTPGTLEAIARFVESVRG
jgi:pimeloyl-ACP methyl ester carboxylesterase